jgi:hypothetical protein
MSELCLTLVLVLDPQAAFTHAAAAAASARPCTRVLNLTGKPEADRALVGSIPQPVRIVAYGPAAAAAVVGRWPDREVTIGGIGPANVPYFSSPNRRIVPNAPSAEAALSLAVRLLPGRINWCLPQDQAMVRDRLDRARQNLARSGITMIGYRAKPPAGCQGLIAWFEGPAATASGLQSLVRAGESMRLPVLGFDPRLLDEGVDLAVGAQLPGYFTVLLSGGTMDGRWLLYVDPASARRKGLSWPGSWPQLPLQLVPKRKASAP